MGAQPWSSYKKCFNENEKFDYNIYAASINSIARTTHKGYGQGMYIIIPFIFLYTYNYHKGDSLIALTFPT